MQFNLLPESAKFPGESTPSQTFKICSCACSSGSSGFDVSLRCLIFLISR